MDQGVGQRRRGLPRQERQGQHCHHFHGRIKTSQGSSRGSGPGEDQDGPHGRRQQGPGATLEEPLPPTGAQGGHPLHSAPTPEGISGQGCLESNLSNLSPRRGTTTGPFLHHRRTRRDLQNQGENQGRLLVAGHGLGDRHLPQGVCDLPTVFSEEPTSPTTRVHSRPSLKTESKSPRRPFRPSQRVSRQQGVHLGHHGRLYQVRPTGADPK